MPEQPRKLPVSRTKKNCKNLTQSLCKKKDSSKRKSKGTGSRLQEHQDHHLNGDLPSGPGSSSLKTFLLEREPRAAHLSSLHDGCAL